VTPGGDKQHLYWRDYYRRLLGAARRDAVAILKDQVIWDLLVIVGGAIVGLVVLGEPAGTVVGILVGAIAALVLVIVFVAAWCVVWAPVNVARAELKENQTLQENVATLQGQLDEGKDKVATAIQELERSGHLDRFRHWGKEFVQGPYTLYSGFNHDGIQDLLMMKLIKAERIPNPPKPLEPLEPGAMRTGYREPPFHTLWVLTDLGVEVWKKISEDDGPVVEGEGQP
jgi:hypothetical protein